MKLGHVPVIGPMGRAAYRQCVRLAKRHSDETAIRTLAELDVQSAKHIAEALRQYSTGSESDKLAPVEAERKRFLTRLDPLDDGSAVAGPYDSGVRIADACHVSAPPKIAHLLYLLARQFKPNLVLELGTNVGISAAYQAMALRENGAGKVVTFEASPYRLRTARELHRRLGIYNVEYVQGLFKDTLPSALKSLPPVDYAFIDGHHQYQPTLDYFRLIRQHATPECLYVFDDIRWSKGMREAWADIQADNRTGMVVDLCEIGLCADAGTSPDKRYVSPTIYLPIYR